MLRIFRVPVSLQWESGWGNNISCHEALWGQATKTFRKHGKELALSIDDSKAQPFNPALTNWSYETDWADFKDYASVLINMGTYPGGWARGISYPAWQYLKPFSCADAAVSVGQDPTRTCGLEGQIIDMIKFGSVTRCFLHCRDVPAA